MNRKEIINNIKNRSKPWDFIIIGGGATGIGCAVDAASRGFDVLLLEQSDFGKGTSSRSTKLVHGGVRYLAQGNLSLVREALKERGILLKNAPHLVRSMKFIVPCYSLWQKFFYGTGLKIYNFLSGKYGFGKSRILSKKETIEHLPNIKQENLSGGVLYFDGQFDDTRLLIDLTKTAIGKGAVLLNYVRVFGFAKNSSGKVCGVNFTDEETGELFEAKAKVVINATGAFCDSIRKFSDNNSKNMIAPSQGIHLVFDKKFLNSDDAIMIPKTSDGRVLFAIPFHNKTLVGTTDTPIEKAELEPQAFENEIEFILETAKNYLTKSPKREDILSIFVGIRPLVKFTDAKNTAALSRDHTIEIDEANLLTIAGGKWTTYRAMAEDAVNQAIKLGYLPNKKCVTENLKIEDEKSVIVKKLIEENPDLAEKIHEDFEYQKAEIIYALRNEMARKIEDILARRTRILFLDARAALESAPLIADIMAKELNKDDEWVESQISDFNETAKIYLVQ
jgi:glycerol-3-phosphate dehydrogenase